MLRWWRDKRRARGLLARVAFGGTKQMPDDIGVRLDVLIEQMLAQERHLQALAEQGLQWHKAEKVARQLLLTTLSPQQRRQVKNHNWFEVRGNATGAVYRVHAHKYLGNIWDVRANKKYCICVADRKLPLSDHVLAQKLLLEVNEAVFLKTANATRLA